MLSQRNGYWMPFPEVPDCIKTKYSISNLLLRPFGLFEDDLEVDFNQKFRPHLVTQILEYCTRDEKGKTPEQDFFLDLTISKRTECLLDIATWGSAVLPIQLRCMNKACQEPMVVEISLEEIADLQHRTDATDSILQIGSDRLMIRKPTGNHQLEWLKSSFPNEEKAIKTMICTLLQNNAKAGSEQEIPISDKRVRIINESMEEFDPLVNFNPTIYCPYCNKENHYEINLEEISLHKLHEAQKNLIQTVHRLALHYSWSEREILCVPPWRRFHYLTLIEKEVTQ